MAHYPPHNNFTAQGFSPCAAYILHCGPMPAATNQQLAVAGINAALDSGMFDGTRRFDQPDEDDSGSDDPDETRLPRLPSVPQPFAAMTAARTPPAAPSMITVNLPIYSAKTGNKKDKKAPTLATNLVLPSDIVAAEFFSRVHAHINIDPATAKLGWEELAEHCKDPYHRLETVQDLHNAFQMLLALQKSRCKRPVIMEVVNTEIQPDGTSTRQVEKDTEKAVMSTELRNVQAKLSCAIHPGHNRWCYVMPPDSKDPGKHVPLGIDVVTLRACKIHDGEVDKDCVTPPSILNLNELAQQGRAQQDPGSRGCAQAALPPIHVHVGGANRALHDTTDNVPRPTSFKHPREATSSSESSDEVDTLCVSDVLNTLHEKFPDLAYPQYASALRQKGIVDASSVLKFEKDYFKENVGMADGAIGKFIKTAAKWKAAVLWRQSTLEGRPDETKSSPE
ncbi:hypothetical protein B0H16DRAFT_1903145 [Mycena metata]|uniref:Uncharacterized protein n=2 Tax=Mycena metata TaxID=1033252 RepID=A0AAD7GKU1_9AGAR|nr:hypothetical protein B0H16DRAFT_1903145 [Mycena metata]